MKLRPIIACLFLGLTVFCTAQSENPLKKDFSLFAGPSFGNIKNNNISSDPYADPEGNTSVNGGINYCKFFKPNLGFVFGLEYSNFKNTATYKGFYRSTELKEDPDGYVYYPVAEVDYKDVRRISTVDIPLALRLQYKKESAAVFLDAGIKANITLASKFEQEGTAASKGLYPNPNTTSLYILIENAAYYNFATVTYTKNEEWQVNRLNCSFMLSGGVKAKMADNCFLVVNPYYMVGLTDISSKYKKDYENIFGEKKPYSKFTVTQFALRMGLNFEI